MGRRSSLGCRGIFGCSGIAAYFALVGCSTALLGCSAAPKKPEEPLGKLPNAVTTAVPEWVPFRVRAGKSSDGDPRERRLAWLRQLTDDGASAAAVWHPDGRSLVFERRLPEDGCGVLMQMDLSTGATRRLSPAQGWSNSASFGPDATLLFAYAASAGPPCLRGEPAARDKPLPLLTWSLPKSDIWSVNAAAQAAEPRARIESPGYDGELSSAVDGALVFTSTREGDPELYLAVFGQGAASDGTAVTRITQAAGYDGHATFSPDGSKLVWHADRFGQNGHKPPDDYRGELDQERVTPHALRLYVAGNRGQHARELPALGNYDITPVFLPDSRRILFASDYDADPSESGAGFELYLRDPDDPESADGRPITSRITYARGFDGDARFSPDGHWLVFTSSRGAKPGGTNLFVARWIGD